MTTPLDILDESIAEIARDAKLPPKPAWLLRFEYLHCVEFTAYSDYRPACSYGVWGASISEAQARLICEAYGATLERDGAGLEYKRFSIVRAAGWMVCAYQRDE